MVPVGRNERAENRRRRAAWILGLGLGLGLGPVLAAAGPGEGRDGEPPAGANSKGNANASAKAAELAGKRVVPRHAGFALRDQPDATGPGRLRAPGRTAAGDIYQVEGVEGASVRLHLDGGPAAWADADAVVPVNQAVAYFSEAIAANPKDAFAYAMRAKMLLIEREDAEHALADCDEAIRLDPNSPLAYEVRGAVRSARDEYDKAVADFSQVIRLRPDEAAAYGHRGAAYTALRQFPRAIADFTEAIRKDPKDAAAYTSRAMTWMMMNQAEKAIADFDEALKINPQDIDAYAGRAAAAGAEGRRRPRHRRLHADHPPRAQGRAGVRVPRRRLAREEGIRQGDRRLQRGHPPRPEEPRRVPRPRPDLREKREYDRAIADCDTAIKLGPEAADPYAVRAGIWTDKTEHDQAIADYTRVIQLDPRNAWAYCNRGLAWFEKRDYDRALLDLDRSVRLDPGSPWSYSNRGMVWYEKKAYDKAVADLERAPEAGPRQPRRAQRPRLDLRDVRRGEVPRRQARRRAGDAGLQADRVEGAGRARHAGGVVRRGRRLRRRREVAGRGQCIVPRGQGEGRGHRPAAALPGAETLPRDRALRSGAPPIIPGRGFRIGSHRIPRRGMSRQSDVARFLRRVPFVRSVVRAEPQIRPRISRRARIGRIGQYSKTTHSGEPSHVASGR